MSNDAWSRGRVATILFAGFVLAGVGATILATMLEVRAAEQRDERLADFASERLSGSLERSVTTLLGTDALAADSEISGEEVAAFGADVLPGSLFAAIAFSEIVPGDELDRWQQETGIEARDTDGQGGFVPVTPKPEHIVVTRSFPDNEATQALRGFDIASGPIRYAASLAARESGRPVVAGPISLASGARPGMFVIKGVIDGTGAPVGFVSSGFGVDDWLALLGESADSIALSIGDELLSSRTIEGATRTFTVGGAGFEVVADDPHDEEWWLPVLLGVATVLVAALAGIARRAERRHRQRRQRLLDRQALIAELGRRLAGAMDADEILAICAEDVNRIVDSKRTLVARVDPSDWAQLITRDSAAVDDTTRAPVDDTTPLGRCIGAARSGLGVSDAFTAVWEPSGSTHCVALHSAARSSSPSFVIGALALDWTTPPDESTRAELDSTIATIAELASHALDRTLVTEAIQDRTGQLSRFAQALALAETGREITQAVERWVPSIVDAERATVAGGSEDADQAASVEAAAPGDRLRVEWPGTTHPPNPTTDAVVRTLGRMVEAAWERAERHGHEHDLVQRMQGAVLESIPPIDALDIAVRYQPAVSAVGVGGDWYDVLPATPTLTFVVVGDIVGHGPAAVTVMAEAKAIVRHLLLAGHDMDEVLEQLDACLQRHRTFATLVLIRIDTADDSVTVVNAGHPYPILSSAAGTRALHAGHGPLVGWAAPRATPRSAPVPYTVGDTLLVYTDGLIERRGIRIDDAIETLVTSASARLDLGSDELADRLLAEREAHVDGTSTDDDVVVVVARRLRG